MSFSNRTGFMHEVAMRDYAGTGRPEMMFTSTGMPAETAELDALDEQAVDKHLQSVIDKAGRVNVSFNAIGIPNTTLPGVPLVDRAVWQFACRSRPMRGRTF